MNKQQFAEYLIDVADEIRVFPSTKAYIDDVCATLIHNVNMFWKEEKEANRIRACKHEENL